MTRLAVLSEQYNVELQTARSANPLAVFFIPTLPTPLFIDPNAITKDIDGLFVLKAGHESAIPDGLIPTEKLNDPAQLSSVLARVISMHIMLASGVKFILLHVDAQRPKADGKSGFVDDAAIKALQVRYPKQLISLKISRETYEIHKNNISAATYSYDREGKSEVITIDAQQIHTAKPDDLSAVLQSEAAQKKVDQLNLLMSKSDIQEQLCRPQTLPEPSKSRDALFGRTPPHITVVDPLASEKVDTSLPGSVRKPA